MRKLLALILCGILALMALAGCNKQEDTPQVVVPEAQYATITFVVDEELYACTAPDPIVVTVGDCITPPIPEDGMPLDEHDKLWWFTDEELINPFDIYQPVLGDMTLYLFEIGKTYSIRYQDMAGQEIKGSYVYSYQYMGESAALPTVEMEGHSDGLYCIELDKHYIRVPTSAGMDLTFTLPKAIEHAIHYATGVTGVPLEEMDNPNPTTFSTVDGTLHLLPAAMEGKVFKHWVLRLWGATNKTFVIEGKEVAMRENLVIDTLSYEMICWGQFTLEAKWE